MLDAVNILHQKHIAHGNITILLSFINYDYPVLLKLCNLGFTSPVYPRNSVNSISVNESQNRMPPVGEI